MDYPPYKAQRIVNKVCYEYKIPSLYCFSQRSAGKLLFVNPKKSACLDCLLTQEDTEHFNKLVSIFLKNQDLLITANTLTNIWLLTSWICKKWIDMITKNVNYCDSLWRYDFDTFSERKFQDFRKNEACPTCGNKVNNSLLWEILKIE
ncbi:hypothetical protein N1495_07155 [Streptococcus didelphis]|uniref:THIF-type NAD/FAD binding fold domain-containing protein n=1 Tax=Streptococcus didelphis TaxID=102886 RepID=A0ABY9LHX8_9STRE|nr:hypothetical protein [Streptococcus didelphis]WMB28501.1 hypothetical protein N1496_02720 [Streptococcus didelphis]WMB29177.1 hypothetical protein N1495_07155 [Streptococcus didelphis]